MKEKIIRGAADGFIGLGAVLAAFQMLPSDRINLRTGGIMAAAGLITGVCAWFIGKFIRSKISISKKSAWILFAVCTILSMGLVILFHLSFPQKEIILMRREIRISVLDESSAPQETPDKKNPVIRFLSVNNAYRGIPFSDFTQSGKWERNGNELDLNAFSGNDFLIYRGFAGRNVSASFMVGPSAGTVQIDWGDGSEPEKIDLSRSDTMDFVSLVYPHNYGATARKWEKINFVLNLYSVMILMLCFFWLYFAAMIFLLKRRSRRFAVIFLVLSVMTAVIRIRNCYNFALGFDEGTYSRAAMRYSNLILTHKWKEIPDMIYNYEHPGFVKLIFSIPATIDGRAYFDRFGWNFWNRGKSIKEDYTIFTGRLVNSFFSLLTVQALIYLVHPIAGFLFMIDSLACEYGAQARIEAIPMFSSFLSAWLFERFLQAFTSQDKKKALKYLIGSALFLGMTAASKDIYCVIVFPMVLLVIEKLIQKPGKFLSALRYMLLMAVISVAFYYLFNPIIWKDPVGRVKMILNFHETYQSGTAAEIYPWWQPVNWIVRSVPLTSPEYFKKDPLAVYPETWFFACDEVIFFLACFGAFSVCKKRRFYAYWFWIGLIFLFLWGTKWEQYGCLEVVPLCISAFYGIRNIAGWFKDPDLLKIKKEKI